MTPQELKSSILQLAIQGKLVEQRPEDGTGEELFLKIQAEKQALIKAGKIKKGKATDSITEEELPFEIPSSWRWVRLGEISHAMFAGGDKPKDFTEKPDANRKVPVVANGITNDGILGYTSIPTASANTITVAGRGTIGFSMFREYVYCPIVRLIVVEQSSLVEPRFLQRVIEALPEKSLGTSIPQLTVPMLYPKVIPLPPLAEQKRIVSKLEEILPLIDRYEAAWNKLEEFNKRFPGDMQKSILQLAIQGKLVEQRPEEGTGEELFQQIQAEKQALIKAGKIKKEKPLPEIAENEIPFDIPDTWKWVKIGSLLHKLVDGAHRTPKYTTSGVPFVSVRNMSSGVLSLEDTKFISLEEHRELWKRCNPERNDLLLSKVGTTGVPAKVNTDKEFSLFVSVALLKFNNDLLDIDFLYYSILAPDFQKQCREHTRGVGNKNWVIQDIANTIMPLPPLAEQKRIVAKLEEILPLCDRLK